MYMHVEKSSPEIKNILEWKFKNNYLVFYFLKIP